MLVVRNLTKICLQTCFLRRANFPLRTSVQYYFRNITVNEKLERILKNKDNISDEYKIVYRAPFYTFVKIVYGVNLSTLSIFPLLAWKGFVFTPNDVTVKFLGYELSQSPFELGFFSFSLTFIVYVLSVIIRNYPLRIYCSEKHGHYIVVRQSLIPLKNTKEEFQAGDLTKLQNSLWIPWHESLYKYRNRKVLLLENYFQKPIDLVNMMTPVTKKNENIE